VRECRQLEQDYHDIRELARKSSRNIPRPRPEFGEKVMDVVKEVIEEMRRLED
jgi:hypothetical protein